MAKKQITKSESVQECKHECCNHHGHNGSHNGMVYGLGVIGAAIYYFPLAEGARGYLMAIFQSIVWPATLVYRALTMLKLGL